MSTKIIIVVSNKYLRREGGISFRQRTNIIFGVVHIFLSNFKMATINLKI